MKRPIWAASAVVLAVVLSGIPGGGRLSSDAAAQVSLPGPLGETALLAAGGRTLGGPGVALDDEDPIFDTCRRDVGGAALGCEPVDVCLTVVNSGPRPVHIGLLGEPGDVLVSLFELEQGHSQTTCARGVVTIDVNPTSAAEEVQLGRLGVPIELHWRLDVMPGA